MIFGACDSREAGWRSWRAWRRADGGREALGCCCNRDGRKCKSLFANMREHNVTALLSDAKVVESATVPAITAL